MCNKNECTHQKLMLQTMVAVALAMKNLQHAVCAVVAEDAEDTEDAVAVAVGAEVGVEISHFAETFSAALSCFDLEIGSGGIQFGRYSDIDVYNYTLQISEVAAIAVAVVAASDYYQAHQSASVDTFAGAFSSPQRTLPQALVFLVQTI